MNTEQKYLREIDELKLFSELYQKFYDKIKYSLSDIQKKAFEAIFYNTQKIYKNIINNRSLSFNNSATEFIPVKLSSLNINLSKELSELQTLVDTPIKQISSDWFYLFVIISYNLQNILTQKNKLLINENLLIQRYCEHYVKKNQVGRINGGKKTVSHYDMQRKAAEQIYIIFKNKHPELINKFKTNPKCNKPKTELKKMLQNDKETYKMNERTLQRWSKELLENDGVLIKNMTTTS